MKVLNDYIVQGALYQADTGPEAQVNDQVRLFLNTESNPGFPEYVVGVIQHPIVKVQCNSATAYDIEYNEADLLGAAALLTVSDVIDTVVITAYDVLEAALADHLADTTAHLASSIVNTPTGTISATNVQTALNELGTEKAPLISPVFTTPSLGVATATSINKVTITQPATGATLTLADNCLFSTGGEFSTASSFFALGAFETQSDFYVTGSSPVTLAMPSNGAREYTFPTTDGTLALTSQITLAALLPLFGVPTYADLTAANTALTIGRIYYDTSLATLNVTTA